MGVSFKRSFLAVSVAGALCATTSAYATNAMQLEGYGVEASAMGGVSQAYDVGTAAMMNNPATIGLMDYAGRLDVAAGNLRPDVTATAPAAMGGSSVDSDATSFIMPAVGFVHKVNDQFSMGVGVFSQGGMGTEYSGSSWMSMGTGQTSRSEVSVGRVIVPLNFAVNDKFNIGGSFDMVWGGMDIQMAMPVFGPGGTAPPGTFADLGGAAFGGSQVMGTATMTPGLATGVGNLIAAGYDTVRINFSNDNDFTGAAKGYGYAGKIGFTYKINPTLNIGGSYHSRTFMNDWETDDGAASMEFYDVDGGAPTQVMSGKMVINNFQWPAQWAAGVAYQPGGKWMLAADVKYIQWKDVMENFSMTFESNGQSADMTLYQDWKNQTVIELGGAYKVSEKVALRAGLNLSDNIIPDSYVNPLFPAITGNHVTAGVGWNITKKDIMDFSGSYALKEEATNSNTGVAVSMSQVTLQVGYSRLF
jgi:long-chain fatty acid transport protein